MRNKIILLCLILLAWSTVCLAQDIVDKAQIALGNNDSIYVINDSGDSVAAVEKYDNQGKFIKVIYADDSSKYPYGSFCDGIATDRIGNIYVSTDNSDSNSPGCITKYNQNGKKLNSFNGDYDASITIDKNNKINMLSVNKGTACIMQIEQSTQKPQKHVIKLPGSITNQDLMSLAIGANGRYYVRDNLNNWIYVSSSTGKLIDTLYATSKWEGVSSMSVDSAGNLYCGVYSNNPRTVSVQKFSPSGRYLTTFSLIHKDTWLMGIAVSATGDVYTIDHYKVVRRFSPKGKLLTQWKLRTNLP